MGHSTPEAVIFAGFWKVFSKCEDMVYIALTEIGLSLAASERNPARAQRAEPFC
jgi:hypothetical protein